MPWQKCHLFLLKDKGEMGLFFAGADSIQELAVRILLRNMSHYQFQVNVGWVAIHCSRYIRATFFYWLPRIWVTRNTKAVMIACVPGKSSIVLRKLERTRLLRRVWHIKNCAKYWVLFGHLTDFLKAGYIKDIRMPNLLH